MYAGVIFYNDTPDMLRACLAALKACDITTIAIDGAFKEFLAGDVTGKLKPYSTDGCIEVARELADYYVPAPPWCWQDQPQKRSCYLHLIPENSLLIVVDADEIIKPCKIDDPPEGDIFRIQLEPERFSSIRVYRTKFYLKYMYRHCNIYNLLEHTVSNPETGALVRAHAPSNMAKPLLFSRGNGPVTLEHRKADRPDERKELKRKFYTTRQEEVFRKQEEGQVGRVTLLYHRRVVGAITTMVSRRDFLVNTVNSIINQVDELYICLNDYRKTRRAPPEICENPKIKLLVPDQDQGSIGRFIWNTDPEAYYAMFDDDLIYPPDYIRHLINGSRERNDKVVVTLHGKIFKSSNPQYWRFDVEQNYPCLDTVGEDTPVHVGGTGAMMFYGGLVKVTEKDFQNLLYDDIEFSALMQKAKVPIVVLKHNAGYLKYQDVGSDTIWNRTCQDVSMTEDLNRLVRGTVWTR